MSSGVLAVKHVALCAKRQIYFDPEDYEFDFVKRSKPFRGLISRLTAS